MEQLFLIVDLEATCSDDGSIVAEQMETIEIGACWAFKDGSVIDQFQSFVRPTVNPILTSFCKELTNIRQNDLDDAPSFPTAVKALFEFMSKHQVGGAAWMSWGMYDRKQITRESLVHQVADPLPIAHHNAKRLFAKAQKIGKEVGMARACSMAKLELQGAHHRALDDAKNISRLLPWILAERKLVQADPAKLIGE